MSTYCVPDSIREFLRYLVSADLLDGFSRDYIDKMRLERLERARRKRHES